MKKLHLEVRKEMPTTRGKVVDTSCFVDSDHAGNKVTRKSPIGIIIYMNMAPNLWCSKRQNSAKMSTFGSEFVGI